MTKEFAAMVAVSQWSGTASTTVRRWRRPIWALPWAGERHCDRRGEGHDSFVRPDEDRRGGPPFGRDRAHRSAEPFLGVYLQPDRRACRRWRALSADQVSAQFDARRGRHGPE